MMCAVTSVGYTMVTYPRWVVWVFSLYTVRSKRMFSWCLGARMCEAEPYA